MRYSTVLYCLIVPCYCPVYNTLLYKYSLILLLFLTIGVVILCICVEWSYDPVMVQQANQHMYMYREAKKKKDRRKAKNEQYQGFARAHAPYYWPGSTQLNFRDRTRPGVFKREMTVHTRSWKLSKYKACLFVAVFQRVRYSREMHGGKIIVQQIVQLFHN